MEREEAIKILADLTDNLFLHTWEKQNKALHMAIEALTEPINCVKCKHYYETEDDTDVHGHCKMDTAHTNLIGKEEAIERIRQNKAAAEFYAGQSRITAEIENALKDSEAFDMAIEALKNEPILCEDCRHRNTWDNQRFDPQYHRCGKGVKFRDYGYVREDDYCPLGERRSDE